MPFGLTVIIPAYNEENAIEASIRSCAAAGAAQIIVSDGGSTDATMTRAINAGAEVISTQRPRGRQMNSAAARATGDALLFLHADSLLPEDAAGKVEQTLSDGFLFGGFTLSFIEPHRKLRMVARMINLRTRITRCPWGDQGQFLSRDLFLSCGGYREIAIMEDYELAIRMKRKGKTAVVPSSIQTSGRRFLRKGVLATTTVNWTMIAAYRLGVGPDRLERLYRGNSSDRVVERSEESEA